MALIFEKDIFAKIGVACQLVGHRTAFLLLHNFYTFVIGFFLILNCLDTLGIFSGTLYGKTGALQRSRFPCYRDLPVDRIVTASPVPSFLPL